MCVCLFNKMAYLYNIALPLLFLSLWINTNTAEPKNKDLPNILFLYADDLGIGDVGAFGNTTVKTPNIDRICLQGIKLTQHLAAAPVCTPSRAALMTSRLPIRTGLASPNDWVVIFFVTSHIGLPPEEKTLPQMLKDKGYTTALIGKWHLGMDYSPRDRLYNPTNFGFDYFFGTPLTNIRDFGPDSGHLFEHGLPELPYYFFFTWLSGIIVSYFMRYLLGRKGAIVFAIIISFGVGYFWTASKTVHLWNSVFMRNKEIVEVPINFERMTQRLVNEGVQFLEQRYEDKKPFFLMMSWLQVHTFLHASSPFKGRSSHGPYGDEVEEMDWAVGQMTKALTQLGLDKNTIIYFSSDNGGHKEEMDPQGRRTGGWNGSKVQGGQEGGIREPTCLSWPGHLSAGSEVFEPTSQMDLMPTLAHIVGGEMPTDRHIDGKNILPLLEGKEEISPHEFMFHYCGDQLHSVRYRPRKGKDIYKLHYYWPDYLPNQDVCEFSLACRCYTDHYKLDKPKLFNINLDPTEKDNLDLTIPKYKGIVNKIQKATEEHMTTTKGLTTQMTVLNNIGTPMKQPFCSFPWKRQCQDPHNALNYKPKYFKG